MPGERIELTTLSFSEKCSTTELPRPKHKENSALASIFYVNWRPQRPGKPEYYSPRRKARIRIGTPHHKPLIWKLKYRALIILYQK